MTTDQIKRTAGTFGTDTDESTTEASTVLETAQTEAKQILAKARYEAFRMVTDARSEAESILSEAEVGTPSTTATDTVNTEEAEAQAAAIIANAQEQAGEIITEAQMQASRLYETSRASVEQQTAVLRERHAALEAQVAATQALLLDLEKRLAMIASPSSPDPAPLAYSLAGEPETPAPTVQHTTSTDNPEPLPPAASTEHDVSTPSMPVSAAVTSIPSAVVEQASFYSRRSANLPSIGAAGGQDALSAVRSMRSKMDLDG